jgi:hypothetical protein
MESEINFTVRPHLDLSALRADAVKLIEFCDKMEREQNEKKDGEIEKQRMARSAH